MWPLMKSELTRFRYLAIGFAILHLVVLRAVSTFSDLYIPSMAKLLPGLMLYALTGLLFGLYQLGSYRKINRWTYLIHRPMEPARILLAIAGGAALLLFAVIAVPWLLVAALSDAVTAQWVDPRQYLMAFFLFGTSLSFYLVGCYIALSRTRAALLAIVLPSFFLTWHAVGLWIFVPQILVIAWLSYLAYSVFKPDLSTHPSGVLPLSANALTLQIAFLLVGAVFATTVYQTGLVVRLHGLKSFAVHSWNDYFPEGTLEHVSYLSAEPAEMIDHGLALTSTDHAAFLRRQVRLAEAVSIPLPFQRRPTAVRHQLMIADRDSQLVDAEEGTVWTFSHDKMLFHGREAVSGRAVGWLGAEGGPSENLAEVQPFVEIPLVDGDDLVTPRRVYHFDPEEQEARLRFELPIGETMVSPLVHHGSFDTIVSDRALYFVEPEDSEEELGPWIATSVVPLPGPPRYLDQIAVAELLDGYLLSFVYGLQDDQGYADARQFVVELALDAPPTMAPTVVAQRSLEAGFPALYRYRAFIASPLVHDLYDLTWGAIASRRAHRVGWADLIHRRLPAEVLWATLLMALVSAVLTAWMSTRRRLPTAARHGWTVAALLTGLPGFLSFLCLTPRREKMPKMVSPRIALVRTVEERA
ncbi:MAG: hypothetical protein K8J08_01110 [Thermoanaerobaculia bacterium]|nr:hypothetical protein [Thermoanaerobaculia bacterium]